MEETIADNPGSSWHSEPPQVDIQASHHIAILLLTKIAFCLSLRLNKIS